MLLHGDQPPGDRTALGQRVSFEARRKSDAAAFCNELFGQRRIVELIGDMGRQPVPGKASSHNIVNAEQVIADDQRHVLQIVDRDTLPLLKGVFRRCHHIEFILYQLCPGEFNITREDACVMAARFMEAMDMDENDTPKTASFTDAAKISGYAKDHVDLCAKVGVINGYPDGTFQPQGEITREETAAMFMRVYNMIP